jgi:LPS sulfotransferase NodH
MASKNKFVIFGLGRSGSTLLKQLLDSHPDIKCEGELFNVEDNYVTNPILRKIVYHFPRRFLNLRRFLANKPIYGFTLLIYQFGQPQAMLEMLHNDGWKIINISRRNSLEQCFSFLVALHTKTWHRFREKEGTAPKLSLSAEELKHWLMLFEKNKKTESEILENLPHYRVVYEDNLIDEALWPETTRKIFEYLGINPAPVSASIQKTYSRPYSEIIENYDELIKYVHDQNLA